MPTRRNTKRKQDSPRSRTASRPDKQIPAPQPPTNLPATDLLVTTAPTRKRRNRAWLALGASMLILAALSVYLPSILQSLRTDIRAEFTEVGDVRLSYGSSQSSGISPVCGCVAEKKYNEWRGITAMARTFELSRDGSLPITTYLLTGAFPDSITWKPKLFMFHARIFEIELDDPNTFDPSRLLSGTYPKGWRVTAIPNQRPSHFLMLATTKPLSVAAMGSSPFSAWIPIRGSKVQMTYRKGMHLSSAQIAEISETYSACNSEGNSQGNRDSNEFPMIDILGPDVVFWSADDSITVTNGESIIAGPGRTRQRSTLLTVVHIQKPPFATRVALQGWGSDALEQYTAAIRRRTTESSPILGGNCLDEGTAFMRIVEPELQAANYAAIRSDLSKLGIITVANIPANIKDQKTFEAMIFRYPPIPEIPGYGVFGDLQDLTLSGAVGKLWAGSKLIDIAAPSELELRSMSFIKTPVGIVSVPHPSLQRSGKVAFRVERASGEVFLNQQPMYIRADVYRPFLDAFQVYNLVFAAIAAITGIVALAIAYVTQANRVARSL